MGDPARGKSIRRYALSLSRTTVKVPSHVRLTSNFLRSSSFGRQMAFRRPIIDLMNALTSFLATLDRAQKRIFTSGAVDGGGDCAGALAFLSAYGDAGF